MSMAVINSSNDLVDKALDEVWRELLLDFPQVLLEVVLHVFEDEVQAVVGVDHFFQSRKCQNLNSKETYSTTFGCFRPFSKEISLIAVEGTPSTSFSSLIFFKATY